VADIACGTGIFTRMLLDNGHRVIGVEPNRDMREAAERLLASYPNFTSVTGTAEATNLAVRSVDFATAAQAAEIIASDPVAARMKDYPSEAWPTETYIGGRNELFFDGEAIELHHPPAAHTDGDSIVFFRRSDVIATGDIMDTDRYPVIDLARGGSLEGIIDGLNRVLDLAIPAKAEEGGTMVIPGHGRLSDIGDVINAREMVTIVRDRVQNMVKRNMTLEQVKAAKPTRDYDPLYNTPGAFVTGDAFVEAVYRSLKK